MENKKVGAGFGVIILNQQNQILLGKRNSEKEKADSELSGEGTWTMPGGKLEYGETFEQGAIREVKEETGLKIRKPEVICVNNDKNQSAHFITIGLIAKNWEGTPQIMEPDEIVEWKWFSLNEIPENFFFPSKKILKNYIEKQFYIPDPEYQINGIYQDNQGNKYKLLNIAKDSETNNELAVYQSLTTNQVWAKPKQQFIDNLIFIEQHQ